MFTNRHLLRVLTVATLASAPAAAHGQQAYFSAQGEIVAVGDQYNFFPNFSRDVTSAENLFFRTYTHSGGTNAAGAVIPASGFDGELQLTDTFSGTTDVTNDDGGLGLDALLAFPGFADSGDALPLTIDNQPHTLTVRHFNDTNTGLFAVDLIGPADALSLLGQSATGTARLDSLKFGTNGGGSDVATYRVGFNNQIDGAVTVGATGSGLLTFNELSSSLNAGGLISANAGGTITLDIGALNANGGVLLSGGTFTRSDTASFNLGDGEAFTVNSGGSATFTGSLNLGRIGIDNDAVIDGAGSSLTVTGTTGLGVANSTGTLTVRNGATAALQAVNVSADFIPNASGQFTVLSGAAVTTAGITVGVSGSENSSAALSISGTGSSVTQSGAATLAVGNFNNNNGLGSVTLGTGGSLTTGTGLTSIRPSGTVTLNDGGTLNANGDIEVDGGSLTRNDGGTFNLAAGRSLTASNDGQVTLNGGDFFDVNASRTYRIESGADLSVGGAISIFGGGDVVVEGPGSTLMTNTAAAGITSDVGFSGSAGTLTLSGFAQADVPLLSVASTAGTNATTSGTVNVEDTSTLNVENLNVVHLDTNNGTGVVNVRGGSTLTQSSGQLRTTIGNANGGTATLNISDSGVVNTGVLTARVNATGAVNVDSLGELNTGGDLDLIGGTLNQNGGFVNLAANSTLTASAGATIDFVDSFVVNSGATVAITDGATHVTTGNLTVGGTSAGTYRVAGSGSSFTQSDSPFTTPAATGVTVGGSSPASFSVEDGGVINTGVGDLTINVGGTVAINTGGVLNANGNVVLDGGTLRSETPGLANFNLAAGRTLTASGGSTVAFDNGTYRLSNDTTFTLNDSTLSTAGLFTVGAQSDGTLTVRGTEGRLNAGGNTLIGGGGGEGRVTLASGAVATFGNQLQIAELANLSTGPTEGTLALDGSTATSGSLSIATQAPATGGNAPRGVFQLTGGSTFTQTGASSLTIGRDATNGSVFFNIEGGSTFTTGTGDAVINLNGEVFVRNSSVLNANGNFTLNGGTLLGNGTINAANGFTNAGSLALDSEAQDDGLGNPIFDHLEIFGDYTQTASGRLTLDAFVSTDGVSADETLDVLLVRGQASLAGALNFNGGFSPLFTFRNLEAYDPEAFLDTQGITDVFDTVTGHILGDDTALAVTYSLNTVFATRALLGDANLDGFIGQADLDAVLLNFGNSNLNGSNAGVSWVTGDFTGDGFVGQADLDLVLLNFGNGTPANFNAVPEPTSLALLGLGGLALTRRRRRA